MKKRIAIMLTLVLALSLCACGQDASVEETSGTEEWAYEEYMTEDQWTALAAATDEYTANYNDLVSLINDNGVELDDNSFAALEKIPEDIQNLNDILDDPSIMTGEVSADELIQLAQEQNTLVLSFIDQINAILGN